MGFHGGETTAYNSGKPGPGVIRNVQVPTWQHSNLAAISSRITSNATSKVLAAL